jgi:copine 5/8/9
MYPTFGYGAKLPNGQVSHCFALNGNGKKPEVFGVKGIIDAYRKTLSTVTLYGPTYY